MSINKIINGIVKQFDSEDVIRFSDKDSFAAMKSWVHTGSPLLDFNMRTFGFPTGIIEIAGPSMSGKTTLGLMGMKYFLAEHPDDGIAIILSSENRDNKDYAIQLGIPVDRVIIVRITYVEKMFMTLRNLFNKVDKFFQEEKIKTKPVFYIMWDSIGATLSKAEIDTVKVNQALYEKAYDKGTNTEDIDLKHEKVGAFAKEAKKFVKSLSGEMYTRIVHFVMLNHQYETMNGFGPSTKKSTGGEWVSLMPTLRLSVALVKREKIDDAETSQISKVKVIKNDFGVRMTTEIRILLGYGVVLSDDEIDFAIKKGILKKEGAKKISYMNGKVTWSTPREFNQLHYDHNKLLPVLYKQIRKAYQTELIDMKNTLAGIEEDFEEEDD